MFKKKSLNLNDLKNSVFKKTIPIKKAFPDKFNMYFLTNCRLLTTYNFQILREIKMRKLQTVIFAANLSKIFGR